LQEDLKIPTMPITNPKPRNRSNKKLLTFLFLFFITVLIILFFQSSLSKISKIEIEGLELLSDQEVGQAASLAIGDHFFAVSSGEIEKRVKASISMVKETQVTKRFPGIIHIQIQEYPRVAFQFGADGQREAVLADGTVIAVPAGEFPIDKPILTGWSDQDPIKLKLSSVLGELSANALSDISEILPDPSDAYPDKIKIFTRSQFEVSTTVTYLPSKIENLPAYIASLQENNVTTGKIQMLEVDNHAPFDSEGVQAKTLLEGAESPGKTNSKVSPSPSPKESPKPTPKESSKAS
jgi:cell division protein FtsQ